MRKKTLHKYKSLAQKSNLKILISVTFIDSKCRALNLDKYSYRKAVEETEAFSIDPPAIERCRAICPQLSRGVEHTECRTAFLSSIDVAVEPAVKF